MKKILLLILWVGVLISCDDGDIITTTFDFEDSDLQACEGVDGILFFQINDAASESLSVRLNISADEFLEEQELSLTLNGTSNFGNYRIFNGAVAQDYFCNEIPPTLPTVAVEYLAESGTALLTTIINLDDNDGLPFVDSDDVMLEGYGDFDGDGIPNYYDWDDDGDNVPTIFEIDNLDIDGDGDPTTNPKNTDALTGDIIPDYLDTDDDGDGTPTINEDLDQDLNPTNNTTDSSIGANYLNSQIDDSFVITSYRAHPYNFSTDIQLVLNNMVFTNGNEVITKEAIDMNSILNVVDGEITAPESPID